MEEGQAKNGFKPPVVSETVVESETVVSKGPVVSDKPVFKDNKKKMSGGVIACIIILAVLAIGGIGFGVWAMLSQNDKIASLETDLKNCANSNNSENEVETVTCPDGTEIEVTDDVAEDINAEEYIYIGWWGIKIKIPSDLSTVSYAFSHEAGSTKLKVWGVDCSGEKCQYFPDFANASENTSGMVSLVRHPKGTEVPLASPPKFVFSDDLYDYYAYHPQAVYSPSESEWEVASVEKIWDMLTDPNNYSKI